MRAESFDLSRPRRVHVVAIGGAGMSAIATLLAEGGHAVSGSDLVDRPALVPLRRLGVEIRIGHSGTNIADVANLDAVVVSTAVGDGNPEVLVARAAGVPVMNRREFLPAFALQQPFVSVSGTHGKTTTSSLLAVALRGVGADPSWLLGAPVPALGGAASLGAGEYLVLEADESDGSFLAGPRSAAMLTNAEPDHLEFWGGWDNLRAGFVQFLEDTDGPTLVCADDPGSVAIGAELDCATYGFGPSDHRIRNLTMHTDGSEFDLESGSATYRVNLRLPGDHNALNAAGALAMVGEMDLDLTAASGAISTHTGLHRRFEKRGEAGGVVVIDDYAHLPAEVNAALRAARLSGWRRVVAVFQPHRYSRTEALWREFGDAFGDSDELILTEIYPAGEDSREGITGELLIEAVSGISDPANRPDELHWAATLQEVARLAVGILEPGDVFLTLGAGDVRDVGDMVLAMLDD